MTCYTAIFGNYDYLKEPLQRTEGWEYVCFTDNIRLRSKHWKIVYIHPENDLRTLAKKVKLLPHLFIEDHYHIYIDGSFYVNCNLNDFWKKHYRADKLCIMQHPWRNCPYEELQEVLLRGKDSQLNTRTNESLFRSVGIQPNSGQAASGILLRSNDTDSIAFSEAWFENYLNLGPRDQVAWAFTNHHMPNQCHLFAFDYRTQYDFAHVPHNNSLQKQQRRIRLYRTMGIL